MVASNLVTRTNTDRLLTAGFRTMAQSNGAFTHGFRTRTNRHSVGCIGRHKRVVTHGNRTVSTCFNNRSHTKGAGVFATGT